MRAVTGARSLALERAGDAGFCIPIESGVIETAVKFAHVAESIGKPMSGLAGVLPAEKFRHRPVIVLSPHFDDACFALGGFLKALGHGILINIFTRGAYVARPDLAKVGIPPDGIHFIRDSEDREFARACGLRRYDLECEEPHLRGRRPSDMAAGLPDDIGQVEEKLLPLLLALAADEPARPALFAPLGIGRHVNHRAVAEAVMGELKLLGDVFDLHFYEDLPYASNPFHRLAALERLRSRVGKARRQVFVTPWREKRELIGVYQSQHRRTPSFTRFRPAAFPLAAHEAFWSLEQKNIKGVTPCSGIGPASS
ncbi:MAG TPA: hypothetical protein VMU31_02495 [Rhizomicrobium sp.]|nr:hypothetical protein [Rhizomicrobium sp.]